MQEAEDAANNDKLLSVDEAADLLSVSKMTLYR
jgi:DeoR/GlpR family transcriptional regulator of sugar metabolism